EQAKGFPEWVVGSPAEAIIREKILETTDYQDSTDSRCPVAERMFGSGIERPTSFLPALDHAPQFGLDALAVCRQKLQFWIADRRHAVNDVAARGEANGECSVHKIGTEGAVVGCDGDDQVVSAPHRGAGAGRVQEGLGLGQHALQKR